MSTPRDDAHTSPWSLGSFFQDIYLILFRPKFKVWNSNLVETLNLRGNSARGHLRNERSLKKIGTQKIRCKLFVLKKNQGTNTAGRICIHMDAITCSALLLVLANFASFRRISLTLKSIAVHKVPFFGQIVAFQISYNPAKRSFLSNQIDSFLAVRNFSYFLSTFFNKLYFTTSFIFISTFSSENSDTGAQFIYGRCSRNF